MLKILICDDEAIIRNGLKKAIEKFPLDINVIAMARHGEEALALIEEHKPAVVLMDINMPGMKGLDVIEQSNTISPKTQFIIISGHDEFEYAQRACRLNVFDYLLKPVDKENLFQVIQKACEHYIELVRTTNIYINENADNTLEEKAYSLILEKYLESDFSLQQLSDILNVSPSYTTRLVKQKCAMNFSDLINKLRIEQSMKLLAEPTDLKLWEISEAVGYSSQHYFSRVFKNITGYTPLEYRRLFFRHTS